MLSPTVDCHLDWVRYTCPWYAEISEPENLERARPPGNDFYPTGEVIDIGQGYNRGLRLKHGAIFWHNDRPEQGISVQLTGQDLNDIRGGELTEIALLEYIAAKRGTVSTLHSCINVHNAGAHVGDLIDQHQAGTLTKRAKTAGVYQSKTKVNGEWISGDTLYVGSAKSSTQVRVYDKAAEQGIRGDWVRVEIVWRGKRARSAHLRMLSHGIASTTRGAILNQMNSGSEWWRIAMSGDAVEPLPIPRKLSNRYEWLRKSVLPALRREIAEERAQGRDDIYRIFAAVIDGLRPSGQD
jgi:hypothetical protein